MALSRELSKLELSLPLFTDKFQTQGVKRWSKYLREWTSDPNKVGDIVLSVRNASTWKAATLKLQQLPGVGPYSSSQAICTVFLGVFRSEGLLSQLFPGKNIDTDNALVMLTHAVDDGSRDEGLDFPYHLLPDYIRTKTNTTKTMGNNDQKISVVRSAPRKRMKSSETRQKRLIIVRRFGAHTLFFIGIQTPRSGWERKGIHALYERFHSDDHFREEANLPRSLPPILRKLEMIDNVQAFVAILPLGGNQNIRNS